MTRRVSHALVVVCDSLGVGGAPDAAAYGDEGSNTVANTAAAVGGLRVPNLAELGLGTLGDIAGVPPDAARPGTAHGSMIERSAGKDSTTGHWEMAGIVLSEPFPLYPDGFPSEVIEPFEHAIGRGVLGNRPASGTQILEQLGEEHLRTGRPIVYTSGDSVFQIACHTKIANAQTLYEWCRTARRLLAGPHAAGRVIARPFDGEPGAFVRTPRRRDFSLPPPQSTLLDRCRDAGVTVYAVGKIRDMFAGQGVSEGRYSTSNDDGIDIAIDYMLRPMPAGAPVFVFANLVDLDSKFGHRNDPAGYAACLQAFDARVPDLLAAVGEAGMAFVTGDHGCDPTTPPTDHSRERVPVLVGGGLDRSRPAIDLGERATFADLGATVADLLGVPAAVAGPGESFAGVLLGTGE